MPKRAVILHDVHAAQGPPDQSDTLVEAQAIAAALRALGFDPEIVATGLDLASLERTLATLSPVVVVNLIESLEGRGRLLHLVPALLESLGVAFTGCTSAALALTSDKPLAKRLIASAGLPTPAAFSPQTRTGRWIVKSVWEHASLGLDDDAIVEADSAGQTIERRRAELGGDWFAEEFVPGRELNVALIAGRSGPRALPVAEIRFDAFPADKPRIVGYAAKWHSDSFEYQNTPRSFAVEPELAEQLRRLALDCWALFRLEGYARVDFRVDERGSPWVLEVNANPCLSPDAGFAAALAEAGIGYEAAVATLIDDALARASKARRVEA
jgi:D-alanine-D-alanine ligase